MKIPKPLCWLLFVAASVQLGCGGSRHAWIPLTEGASWEYEIALESSFMPTRTGTVRSTNMARRVLGEVDTTPERNESLIGEVGRQTEFQFIAEDEEGVYTLAMQSADDAEPKINSPPHYALKYPVAVGTAWENAGQSRLLTHDGENFSMTIAYQIEAIDQVETVPAGTYEPCVKVTAHGTGSAQTDFQEMTKYLGVNYDTTVLLDSQAWYCQGVGLTRLILSERSNNMFIGSAKLSMLLRSYEPG